MARKRKYSPRKHPRYRSGPKKGQFKPKHHGGRKRRNPSPKRNASKRSAASERALRKKMQHHVSELHKCAVQMGKKGYRHSPAAQRKSRKRRKK